MREQPKADGPGPLTVPPGDAGEALRITAPIHKNNYNAQATSRQEQSSNDTTISLSRKKAEIGFDTGSWPKETYGPDKTTGAWQCDKRTREEDRHLGWGCWRCCAWG